MDVGDSIKAANASWNFGGKVPESFEIHASKSIPLYREGHDLAAKISDYFISDGSRVYDLGCATGVLLKLLFERHKGKNVHFTGMDSEKDMADHASKFCRDSGIEILHADITDTELEKSDLILSYYTMQFIKPAVRQDVFNKIYNSLNWGGAFILFEKVRGPDARFQDMMTGLYNDYKLDRGFTADEILHKSRSLKGVLEPFSTRGNYDLLKRAGFVDIMTVMKYLNFEGILAVK